MTILKIVSFFFLFCLTIIIYAQESYKSIIPVDYTIKIDNYSPESNERQILSSISINNIKNIHLVRLFFKADILLNVQRDDDGHLFAYMKAVNSVVSGDIYFRAFLVDTLLAPLIFDGILIINSKGGYLQEIPIEMLLTGGVLDLDILEKYNFNLDELTFEVKIDKLLFSDQQLSAFMNTANTINSYYSYNEVSVLLLERYGGNQLNRGSSSAETFIAWHHIHRTTSFADSYNLKEELKLESKDPLGFLTRADQLSRLEERASTLFTKELEKGKRGKLIDRNEYCRRYVNISNEYIQLSKKYQPNTVSAFNELVRIYPVDEDLIRMVGVSAFYDVFKITNVPATTQLIYNNFVSSADSALKRHEYLNTLNLMRNAVEMEGFFSEIERSDKFSEVYAGALSGLMKSFLKVSVMAYKSKNFRIAKRYYQQAQQIYDENAHLVGNDFNVKQSFKEFVENQFGLAQMLIEDNYYEDAIELLDLATNISNQNQLEINQIEFDAAYKKGYSGIYGTLVDSIEYYIQQENRKSSLKVLLHSAEFEKSHAHYLDRDERVSGYAVILFEYYMNGSLQKLHNEKPEEALTYLFEARNINSLFLLNKAEQIDSAVRVAIAPIILQIIKKAEFEVWANRLDEAYVLKEQAENSANKYGLIEQKEIEYAMLNLEEKINNRVCIDIQYKVSNACKILVNRIKAGKFKEAELVLRTTKSLISKNPGCNIVNSDLDSLIKAYQPLFYYIENADSLVQQTGAADFFNIKIMYDDLKTSYFENELMEYIDEIPDLQKLMKEKGSIPEYHEAVEYYINQKDFLNAYYYLSLLKLNKVDARNTKHMQQTIGYEICKGEEDRSSLIFDLTKGDSWYKVLNKACLKN